MAAQMTAGHADQNRYSLRNACPFVSTCSSRHACAASLISDCGTSFSSMPRAFAISCLKSAQSLCVAPVAIAPVAYSSEPAPSATP